MDIDSINHSVGRHRQDALWDAVQFCRRARENGEDRQAFVSGFKVSCFYLYFFFFRRVIGDEAKRKKILQSVSTQSSLAGGLHVSKLQNCKYKQTVSRQNNMHAVKMQNI